MFEQSILEYGGLLAAGYSLFQANDLYRKEHERSVRRHQEAIKLAREQHEKDLKTTKQTYLLELFNSLEQHFQQLNADLIASSKESERDMFDQRNQNFQTIILASSVMFAALSTVIVEGELPEESGDFLFVAYALSSALSFAFLFLSIVICIEVLMRASSFMYRRAKAHTRQLKEAISRTKIMMKKLRGDTGLSTNNLSSMDGRDDADGSKSGKINFRRSISAMEQDAVEEEWTRHETEIQEYLAEREKINDRTAIVMNGNGVSRKSFQEFWKESCKSWAELAVLFFYGGSVNLLLAIMLYMWAIFYIDYGSLVGAIIGVVLIGLSLVIGVSIVVVMRHQNKSNVIFSQISVAPDSLKVEYKYPRRDSEIDIEAGSSINGSSNPESIRVERYDNSKEETKTNVPFLRKGLMDRDKKYAIFYQRAAEAAQKAEQDESYTGIEI